MRLEINEKMALVDNNGYIRFFVVDYDDGERHGYLLEPYYTKTPTMNPHLVEGISWVVEAFAAYGLNRARRNLTTKVPNGRNMPVDFGTFLVTRRIGEAVAPLIRSFTDDFFSRRDLSFGYKNIASEKLIFLEPVRLV